MTERELATEPDELFAERARVALVDQERSWDWLSRKTGIHANTLRSQLLDNPARLRLRTARRVSTALDLPLWVEVEEQQLEAVAS